MSDRRIEFLERLGALMGEFGAEFDVRTHDVDYMGTFVDGIDVCLCYQAEVDGELGQRMQTLEFNSIVEESDIYDKIQEIGPEKVDIKPA